MSPNISNNYFPNTFLTFQTLSNVLNLYSMLKVIFYILIAGVSGHLGLPFSGGETPSFEAGEPAVLGVIEARLPARINEDNQGLRLSARSAVVLDRESGKVLFRKNIDKRTPVASISKLATALVFLDSEPDWEGVIYMRASDFVGGARLKVGVGESLWVRDLFYASLISSSNNAVAALVRASGMSDKEFMIAMNKKARELGMIETYFAEPTGLSMVNHSTALDIAKLMGAVLEKDEICEASKLKEYNFKTLNTGRWVKVINTDKLLSSFLNNGNGYKVLGGKTGYTQEAGSCFVAGIRGKEGQDIIAVILGAESNQARFQEMKGLAWWVFQNWRW